VSSKSWEEKEKKEFLDTQIVAEIQIVDWPLPIRALSSIGCACGVVSDAFILLFISKWFVGVAANYLAQELDVELPHDIQNWAAWEDIHMGMDFAIFVIHFYSFVLLTCVVVANLDREGHTNQYVPPFFHHTLFLFGLEVGFGVIQATSVLGMPFEEEWAGTHGPFAAMCRNGAHLDDGALSFARPFLWWLRNVSGFILCISGTWRLLSRVVFHQFRKVRVSRMQRVVAIGGHSMEELL